MGSEEIYNFIKVDDHLATAGQPTEAQWRTIAAEGFEAVINLAPLHGRNVPPDEPGLAKSLGMSYTHIPVNWEDPKESDFAAFETAMSQQGEKKLLIHCAANFRVTAFYSLYAQKHLGWSEERADAFRARIWEGSNYPIWEDFIERIKANINK